MQFVQIMDFGSRCLRELEQMGCQIVATQDFNECAAMCAKMGKESLSPMMSPGMHDFTEGNCFWVFLFQDGNPLACIGAKREQIGRETIASYWSRSNRRQYGQEGVSSVSSLATKHLVGDLAYIGELYVAKGRRGDSKRLEALLHYLHATIFCMWGVEYSYAFIRDRDMKVGMSVRYGFTRQIPRAQTWEVPPAGRQNSEWLVSVSREDFEHIAGHSISLSTSF